METILVVDDSAIDRRLAEHFLMERAGLRVLHAANGQEALASMRQSRPDLVLTDLQMPEVDGLELTEMIRAEFPAVPVVLMTAHGSFDIAVAALERGAASYVPKANLAQDLLRTIDGILAISRPDRGRQAVLDCLRTAGYSFAITNNPALIPPLVGWLEESLGWTDVCDEAGKLRVAVAVREALVHAMEHGNLEASPDLKQKNEAEYQKLVSMRRTQSPYCERLVHLEVHESREAVTYSVRDEGTGFSMVDFPDPADPASLGSTVGRGLVLIHTVMDEVHFNAERREIAMVKRRESP